MINSVSSTHSFIPKLFFALIVDGIANLVLEDTVERIYHQDVFAEKKSGLYLIRGENVVLLGEVVRVARSW